ncbi:MAG: hypothetical protein HY534_04320 [Chloroflexi bacterium]|nr:hypothetical protein [Chloroflexota bacterium]
MSAKAEPKRQGRLLALAATAALVILAACSQPNELREAQGILLEVQSQNLSFADAVVLRTDDGATIRFAVSPDVALDPVHPNTASHLRQHMTGADKVRIRYRETPSGLQAVQIVDW